MSIYKEQLYTFDSYDNIPTNFKTHIMSVADADNIADIPLQAINEYFRNLPVDKFFNILGERHVNP